MYYNPYWQFACNNFYRGEFWKQSSRKFPTVTLQSNPHPGDEQISPSHTLSRCHSVLSTVLSLTEYALGASDTLVKCRVRCFTDAERDYSDRLNEGAVTPITAQTQIYNINIHKYIIFPLVYTHIQRKQRRKTSFPAWQNLPKPQESRECFLSTEPQIESSVKY